jgi:hypothetical protein
MRRSCVRVRDDRRDGGVLTDQRFQKRRRRAGLLLQYCRVVRLTRPAARIIVGLALDPPQAGDSSEDFLVYDATEWDDSERRLAEQAHHESGLLRVTNRFAMSMEEYPEPGTLGTRMRLPKGAFPGTGRNANCPCGGGASTRRVADHDWPE